MWNFENMKIRITYFSWDIITNQNDNIFLPVGSIFHNFFIRKKLTQTPIFKIFKH